MMLDSVLLWIQIALCVLGIGLTFKIYKLINHGNMWWLMSLGFVMLMMANIFTMFYSTAPWYLGIRTVYLPLLIRLAFVASTTRTLFAACREHDAKLAAEKAASETLQKLREFANRGSPNA